MIKIPYRDRADALLCALYAPRGGIMMPTQVTFTAAIADHMHRVHGWGERTTFRTVARMRAECLFVTVDALPGSRSGDIRWLKLSAGGRARLRYATQLRKAMEGTPTGGDATTT